MMSSSGASAGSPKGSVHNSTPFASTMRSVTRPPRVASVVDRRSALYRDCTRLSALLEDEPCGIARELLPAQDSRGPQAPQAGTAVTRWVRRVAELGFGRPGKTCGELTIRKHLMAGSLDDDRTRGVFQVQRGARLIRQVAMLDRPGASAEETRLIKPDAIERHDMWPAVWSDAGKPVVARGDEARADCLPVQRHLGTPVLEGKIEQFDTGHCRHKRLLSDERGAVQARAKPQARHFNRRRTDAEAPRRRGSRRARPCGRHRRSGTSGTGATRRCARWRAPQAACPRASPTSCRCR